MTGAGGIVAGVEVCKVSFDPSAVSYRGLLDVWKDDHDPTRKWANKKFMSAVFAGCTQRKQVLEASALVCSSSAMPCMAEHCGNV